MALGTDNLAKIGSAITVFSDEQAKAADETKKRFEALSQNVTTTMQKWVVDAVSIWAEWGRAASAAGLNGQIDALNQQLKDIPRNIEVLKKQGPGWFGGRDKEIARQTAALAGFRAELEKLSPMASRVGPEAPKPQEPDSPTDLATKALEKQTEAWLAQAAAVGKTKYEIQALTIAQSLGSATAKEEALAALDALTAKEANAGRLKTQQDILDAATKGADAVGRSADELQRMALIAAGAKPAVIAVFDAAIAKKDELTASLTRRSPDAANAAFGQGNTELDAIRAASFYDDNKQIVDGLQEQARYWGMTREQATLARLEFQHADVEQIAAAKAAMAKMTEFKNQALHAFEKDLGRGIHDGLVDAMMGIETNWGEMLKRMVLEFAVSGLLQQLGTLADAKSTAAKGTGASGSWWGAIASMFGGSKASGGPVAGGTMYRVHPGEAFFTPDMSGVVGKVGGGGGGTVISQEIHFDVGLESVDERIRGASGQISNATMAAILKAQSRPAMA